MLMVMSILLWFLNLHQRILLIGRMELWMMQLGLWRMILWSRDINHVLSWIVFNWLMIFKDVDNVSSETLNSMLQTSSTIWLDSEKRQTIIFDQRNDVFKIAHLNPDILIILQTLFLFGESFQIMIAVWVLIFLTITTLIKSSITSKTVFVLKDSIWMMTILANHVSLFIGTVLNALTQRLVRSADLISTCWLQLKMIMWPVNQRWNSVIFHYTSNLSISKHMNLMMVILNSSVKSVKTDISGKILKTESIMVTASLVDNQWIIVFNAIMVHTALNVRMGS